MTDQKVVSINEDKREVADILNEFIELDVDELSIVGTKGTKIYTRTSNFKEVVNTLGCLKLIEHRVLEDWL